MVVPPARVGAATVTYHAEPFLFDTADNLLVDNVGALSPGGYHGPPYQFDASDNLMVDCAVGCGGISPGTTNTFTAVQNFNGAAGSATGFPATNGINFGSGNLSGNAMTIGWESASPFSCASSCTAAQSNPICFYAMSTTGPLNSCPFLDTTAQLNIGKLKVTSALNVGGNAMTGVAKITQQAVNDMWGSCAMAAGTTCTVTWTYAPTFCVAQVIGATPIADAVGISSTTITVTAASSNSATWDVSCQ